MRGTFYYPGKESEVPKTILDILAAVPIKKRRFIHLPQWPMAIRDYAPNPGYEIPFTPSRIICIEVDDPDSYICTGMSCEPTGQPKDQARKCRIFRFCTTVGDIAIVLLQEVHGGYSSICPPGTPIPDQNNA